MDKFKSPVRAGCKYESPGKVTMIAACGKKSADDLALNRLKIIPPDVCGVKRVADTCEVVHPVCKGGIGRRDGIAENGDCMFIALQPVELARLGPLGGFDNT